MDFLCKALVYTLVDYYLKNCFNISRMTRLSTERSQRSTRKTSDFSSTTLPCMLHCLPHTPHICDNKWILSCYFVQFENSYVF